MRPSESPVRRFEEIAPGDSFSLTAVFGEREMRQFEELSGDRSAIHVDPAAAGQHGFPDRLVYGFLVLGMLSRLVGSTFHHAVCASVSIDFTNPVFPNEEIVLSATVDQIQSSMRGVMLKVRFQRGESLVARGRLLTRFLE